ncbi:LacI family transcriptional regulator [bacterium]|nr:MAG: LacI family transcriptional regulator [bacterium]
MSKNSSSLMGGRPTRDDVASRARVSGTTVSRVLGGKPDESVSPAVRARVLEAARELGYVPNSAAQALRRGRTGLIGLWMCLGYSRYRAEVLDRMRRISAETDHALAVLDVDEEYAWHRSFDRALRVPVDGVIAFDASTAGEVFAREGQSIAPNLPFVSMGAYWSEAKSYVGVDLKAGAEMAVDHLLATGRRRIAYLTPQDSNATIEAGRLEGYEERMVASGLEPRTFRVSYSAADRVASIVEILADCRRRGWIPDALLCMFDDIAIDAVPALIRSGLRPGVDVAIVGINGSEGTERGECPITIVRQPIEIMCATALAYLEAQIDAPSSPFQQIILKPELIVRASSRRD